MTMTGTDDITTARLTLRPLREDDARAITRLAGDEEVARWTALVPHPYPDGEAARFIARTRADTDGCVFALALRETPRSLVGVIGLHPDRDDPGRIEIGYWLGRPFWGRGLMGEAVTALARRRYAGARLFAKVFPGNNASMRLLENAGFARRGTAMCDTPARAARRIDDAPLFELALECSGKAAS